MTLNEFKFPALTRLLEFTLSLILQINIKMNSKMSENTESIQESSIESPPKAICINLNYFDTLFNLYNHTLLQQKKHETIPLCIAQ